MASEINKWEKIWSLHKFIKSTINTKRMEYYNYELINTIATAIYNSSQEFNLPPALIAAIAYEESDPKWYPLCVSFKGARGLMQIMPVWDKELINYNAIQYSSELFEIAINIKCGCWILRRYLGEYNNDLDTALCYYHSGHDDITKDNNDIYVAKVRATMKKIEIFILRSL